VHECPRTIAIASRAKEEEKDAHRFTHTKMAGGREKGKTLFGYEREQERWMPPPRQEEKNRARHFTTRRRKGNRGYFVAGGKVLTAGRKGKGSLSSIRRLGKGE